MLFRQRSVNLTSYQSVLYSRNCGKLVNLIAGFKGFSKNLISDRFSAYWLQGELVRMHLECVGSKLIAHALDTVINSDSKGLTGDKDGREI